MRPPDFAGQIHASNLGHGKIGHHRVEGPGLLLEGFQSFSPTGAGGDAVPEHQQAPSLHHRQRPLIVDEEDMLPGTKGARQGPSRELWLQSLLRGGEEAADGGALSALALQLDRPFQLRA
jgi:hypothetical protein